jgi:hypothetical protein
MSVPQILIDKVAESQFSAMTEWEVAEALNAPDASLPFVKQDVSTSDVGEILLASGELYDVNEALKNPSEDIKRACFIVQKTFEKTTNIRTSDPDIFTSVATVLNGLLAAAVISQTTYDVLMSLTNRRPSWAEANNLSPVTSRDVGLARGAS